MSACLKHYSMHSFAEEKQEEKRTGNTYNINGQLAGFHLPSCFRDDHLRTEFVEFLP